MSNEGRYHTNHRYRKAGGRISYHTGGGWTLRALRDAYRFPTDATGKGQLIVCVELGGGHVQADLDACRASNGLPSKQIQEYDVLGARSNPSTPDGPDGEVMLDLCVVSCLAPDADIAVVYGPNSDQGFEAAYKQAFDLKPAAVSVSWGQPEDQASNSMKNSFTAMFKQAGTAGTFASSAAGDNGSSDGETGDHVDFPASDPYNFACGGTTMPMFTGQRVETVWPDTGGGISPVYIRPSWQNKVSISGGGRCVPDGAAVADPATGIIVRVDGQTMVIGGTSAVAPFWAAVVACLNQKLGKRLGFINPLVYPLIGSAAFLDVTVGNNGTYQARPGYDCCTGCGTPNVDALAAALGGTGNGGQPPTCPPGTHWDPVLKVCVPDVQPAGSSIAFSGGLASGATGTYKVG